MIIEEELRRPRNGGKTKEIDGKWMKIHQNPMNSLIIYGYLWWFRRRIPRVDRMQEQWNKLHFEFKPTGVFGEGGERVEEESSIGVAELHQVEVWELISEQMAKERRHR